MEGAQGRVQRQEEADARGRGEEEEEGKASSGESGFSDANQTDQEDQADNNSNDKNDKDSNGNGNSVASKSETSTVFVPPLSFLGEVPSEHLPPLLPPFDNGADSDNKACDGGDDTYSDIYERLVESHERSAEIVSKLASTLGQEDLTISIEEEGEEEEEEEDVEPRTEEEEDDAPVSSDLVSIEEEEEEEEQLEEGNIERNIGEESQPDDESSNCDDADSDTASQGVVTESDSEIDLDDSLESPFPPGFEPELASSGGYAATTDDEEELDGPGVELPIDGEDDDDDRSHEHVQWDAVVAAEDEENDDDEFSPLPEATTVSGFGNAANFSYANVDSHDSDSEEDGDGNDDSTAVTR